MAVILGLNAYHGDSSAAIVVDGKLIAAVEEERFRRIKHWAGFPSLSIEYCLKEAGVSLSDVSHVAINSDPSAHMGQKVAFALKKRPDLNQIFESLQRRRKRKSIEEEFEKHFSMPLQGRVERIEHHLAHLASAYYVGPFERAVAVSVDGFGDFSSAAWGLASYGDIEVFGRVHFPHSLGSFYQAMTQFIGFPYYGDEYKVMGLAPYGEPRFMNEMRQVVRLQDDGRFELNLDYFRHATENVAYTWDGVPEVGTLFSDALEGLLGPARKKGDELTQRHMDLARSIQAMYEEAFFHLLSRAYRDEPCPNLVLSGGCAMNSVANGKVTRSSPFRNVYVQSAAGDAGGAIGSAMVVARREGDLVRPRLVNHAYLGPSYDSDEVNSLLTERASEIVEAGCEVEHFDDLEALCDATAGAIADGLVVGWYQGRLEWGPRALGNRSIVCDPRRADMKDILNLKIKRRESFRPFAPSILRESVLDWFELEDDVPFMMKVFPIRKDKREAIPAVTHADGTGRLQTVFADTNPRYHALIKAFEKRTGVPIVLNTSFNENEPVVCRPVEALDCFLRTKMDVLVLGDVVVRRAS